MKLFNLIELNLLGIHWANRAIFLKVARCGASPPGSQPPRAGAAAAAAGRGGGPWRPAWEAGP